jgi:pentatricopeptide repeat protein
MINACATASAKLARRRGEEDASGGVYGNINVDGDDTTAGLENLKSPMNGALKLLAAMKSTGSSVKRNIVPYNAAIRACPKGLNLNGAFNLQWQLREDGLEQTIITYGALMTACEQVGDVEAASKVFRMVKEEEGKSTANRSIGGGGGADSGSEDQEHLWANEIIYGAAISCCCKAREPERALLLLRKMISEKLEPNTVTYNTVIAALFEGRPESKTVKGDSLWEKALVLNRVMKSKHAPTGVSPNRKTYNMLVHCLLANLQPGIAESLLIDMRKGGFVPNVDLYTMTVWSFGACS